MQTTIKIPGEVHARLKSYANDHGIPLGAAIDELLAKESQRQFWVGVAAQRPDEEYRREADDALALADAEERIAAFEADAR